MDLNQIALVLHSTLKTSVYNKEFVLIAELNTKSIPFAHDNTHCLFMIQSKQNNLLFEVEKRDAFLNLVEILEQSPQKTIEFHLIGDEMRLPLFYKRFSKAMYAELYQKAPIYDQFEFRLHVKHFILSFIHFIIETNLKKIEELPFNRNLVEDLIIFFCERIEDDLLNKRKWKTYKEAKALIELFFENKI